MSFYEASIYTPPASRQGIHRGWLEERRRERERERWRIQREKEMEDTRGKGGRAFEEKRTRTVRDLERNESLLAIIESMAVNHRDPQENKFLEGNREGGSK